MSEPTFNLRVVENHPFPEILKFEFNGEEVTPLEFVAYAQACAEKLQALGYKIEKQSNVGGKS